MLTAVPSRDIRSRKLLLSTASKRLSMMLVLYSSHSRRPFEPDAAAQHRSLVFRAIEPPFLQDRDDHIDEICKPDKEV